MMLYLVTAAVVIEVVVWMYLFYRWSEYDDVADDDNGRFPRRLWAIPVLMVAEVVGLEAWNAIHKPPPVKAQVYPVFEYQDVHILRKYSALRYLLERKGEQFEASFCADYTPDLWPGCGLRLLRYEDHGTCWSVLDKDNGVYLYLHDPEGKFDLNWDGKTRCYDLEKNQPLLMTEDDHAR